MSRRIALSLMLMLFALPALADQQRGQIPHIPVIVKGVGAALEPDAARLLRLARAGKYDKIAGLVDYNPLVCTLLTPFSDPDWAWAQSCHGLRVLNAPERAFVVPINLHPIRWSLQQDGKPTLYSVGVPVHFDKGVRNVRLWVRAADIERVDGKPLPAP
ncbi:MAG TPA: hypothetical protein VFL54_09935 [Gammaproteobacteria bacterium]|nr:hypothetical protein [Gammaproteobacteria bacterium]